jgi:hypothetical protein
MSRKSDTKSRGFGGAPTHQVTIVARRQKKLAVWAKGDIVNGSKTAPHSCKPPSWILEYLQDNSPCAYIAVEMEGREAQKQCKIKSTATLV